MSTLTVSARMLRRLGQFETAVQTAAPIAQAVQKIPDTVSLADVERLKAALAKMRWAANSPPPRRVPNGAHRHWADVLVCVFVGEGAPAFFRAVDWVKEILTAGDLRPLQGGRSSAQLRVALEDFYSRYFGKTHLAVAMAELGFEVAFQTVDYFSTNYRSHGLRRNLATWRKRHPGKAWKALAMDLDVSMQRCLLSDLRRGRQKATEKCTSCGVSAAQISHGEGVPT